jgi:hypothetical protein
MAESGQKTVDFNSILMGLNLIVACLIGSEYFSVQDNPYINQNTVLLGLLLSLQTHIALHIERSRRDPFVIVFAFNSIFYYSLRLYTLALYPFGVVFERYSYEPYDSNFALVFIIIANMFLYAGLLCVGPKPSAAVDLQDWRPTASTRVIALMVVSLIYSYSSVIYWTPETEPRIVSIAGFFISPPIIMLMALSYIVLFRKTLSKKVTIVIGALILLEIAAHTLAGSRSGITTLIQNIMFVLLATASCIKIRRSHFILGCVLAPIVLVLLIGAFTISTFNRLNKEGGGSLDLGRSVELAGEESAELGGDTEWDIVLPPIFDRAGYFDFSAEIIAHADIYKDVFNPSTYAKSIIDNLLTPGFDIYDQPKLGNALIFVYASLGEPSKVAMAEDEYYHSDQFGIYGELYALLGYASLPLFFVIAFGFKRLYVRLRGDNPFSLTMKRLIVLTLFVTNVNSYGMDWTLIEAVPFVAGIYIYKFFFQSRRLPRAKRDEPATDLDVSSAVPFMPRPRAVP